MYCNIWQRRKKSRDPVAAAGVTSRGRSAHPRGGEQISY